MTRKIIQRTNLLKYQYNKEYKKINVLKYINTNYANNQKAQKLYYINFFFIKKDIWN